MAFWQMNQLYDAQLFFLIQTAIQSNFTTMLFCIVLLSSLKPPGESIMRIMTRNTLCYS